ncbi:MAG: hypothetical protein JXR45_08620 [Deltaproteobacteria bacterium]|nr:hypothetical protein [Deltaproteobacteria bacterium]
MNQQKYIIKRITKRSFVLAFVIGAVLLLGSCEDEEESNPWCNGRCDSCPSESGYECEGRVGDQCCYCPTLAFCNDEAETCTCYTYVSNIYVPEVTIDPSEELDPSGNPGMAKVRGILGVCPSK